MKGKIVKGRRQNNVIWSGDSVRQWKRMKNRNIKAAKREQIAKQKIAKPSKMARDARKNRADREF